MRRLFVTVAVCCCGLAIHAGELKSIATVHLSCESPSQFVSPSGEQIAVRCGDHSIRLLDIATGREQHVFPPDDHVTDYSFSRDGRWFAVGLGGGSAEIVPTSGSGEPKRWKATTRGVSAIEFLADDDSILIAGNDEPDRFGMSAAYQKYVRPCILILRDSQRPPSVPMASNWQLLKVILSCAFTTRQPGKWRANILTSSWRHLL